MNFKQTTFLCALLCANISLTQAANFFVATDGKSKNKGTLEAPFASVSDAIRHMSDGDVCYVRGGHYHEDVKLSNAKGLQIVAYNNEEVTFDGTVAINAEWTKYKGNIYQAKIDVPIWQLFVEGRSMTSARHPNGNWYDGSIWKTESMQFPEEGSVKNHFVGDYLKNFDFSLADGGLIIVNSSSWGTSASHITEHTAGSNNFKYDPSTVKYLKHKSRVSDMRYFVEGKLELLDTPGEWFFDPKSQMLYLWAENNANPEDLKIRGKVQSYAISGKACSDITIRGIDFFATSLEFTGSHDMRVEDCDFMFPTYSKRMLGNIKDFDIMRIMPSAKGKANFAIVNCRFEYVDGPAITTSGDTVLIENCYFSVLDYSCVVGEAAALYLNSVNNLTFRHNTIKTSGASATLQLGGRSTIEFNDISQTGFLQHDGSLVQLRVGAADGSIVRNNWLHNSIKTAIRTDNINKPGSPFGVNCTAYNNVSWKTDRGTFFKGDKHFVFNNICFDNIQRDLIISSNEKINGFNHSTITRNNLTNTFSGHQSAPTEKYPVPGIADHNWVGEDKKQDIRSQVRDADNLDFRPRKGSEIIDAGVVIEGKDRPFLGNNPDIGAYEYGDTSYWIPGYMSTKASVPIPCDGSVTAKADADLMWLKAYKSNEFKVYLGTSPDNLQLISTQRNNICTPPSTLNQGKTYYWRVDCKGEKGESKGDVWSFSVK